MSLSEKEITKVMNAWHAHGVMQDYTEGRKVSLLLPRANWPTTSPSPSHGFKTDEVVFWRETCALHGVPSYRYIGTFKGEDVTVGMVPLISAAYNPIYKG